jgi:hypothetical protein
LEFIQEGRLCKLLIASYIQAASKFIRNARGLNMQSCIQRTTAQYRETTSRATYIGERKVGII